MFGIFKNKNQERNQGSDSDPIMEGHAYVIGDIHGCYDELCELLDLIEADAKILGAGPKQIIFLGDLMDRGPKSNEVIELLSNFKPSYAEPVFIMGNHEEVFLKVLAGSVSALMSWFEFGGRSCVRSYGVKNLGEIHTNADSLLFRIQEKVPPRHIEFIESFQDMHQFGPYLCVHAGIKPRVAIEKQSSRDLRWIRNEFMAYKKQHPLIIVHGHTIVETVEVLPNRIAVDTGTYDGGPLTAVRLGNDGPHILQTVPKSVPKKEI